MIKKSRANYVTTLGKGVFGKMLTRSVQQEHASLMGGGYRLTFPPRLVQSV